MVKSHARTQKNTAAYTHGCQHVASAVVRIHSSVAAGGLQRQQAVMTSSAVNEVLTSIPGLHLQQHQADLLRIMGSLQTLAGSSAEDILDSTDLDQPQYELSLP